MPVYNAEAYLAEAIESILCQSFKNFEFIIIDDGSTDNSASIIKQFTEKDSRIVAVSQTNQGLGAALNRGINEAKGNCIARMDADDIAHPDRFEKQLQFMKENPECGICGTFHISIDHNGTELKKVTFPTADDDIKLHLLWYCPISHPTVMIQRVLVQENKYGGIYHNVEDYDLWLRLTEKTKFYNIPEYLLKYRKHEKNYTRNKLTVIEPQMHELQKHYYIKNRIDLDDKLHKYLDRQKNILGTDFIWALIAIWKSGHCLTFFSLYNSVLLRISLRSHIVCWNQISNLNLRHRFTRQRRR